MSSLLPRQQGPGASQGHGTRFHSSITSRPARDASPHRMIVTAGVVALAVREWSLWALLRVGPWGAPMRLVLERETVMQAVLRTLNALLMWPEEAILLQIKSGWQEQQVHVWGSSEQGSAISLMHCILLRANRDELQPHLLRQPVPSLHVQWVPVADIESGVWKVDAEAYPGVLEALESFRTAVRRNPLTVVRYLADMDRMSSPEVEKERWQKAQKAQEEMNSAVPSEHETSKRGKRISAGASSRDTIPLGLLKPPAAGNGTFTLAEARTLYHLFSAEKDPEICDAVLRSTLEHAQIEKLSTEQPIRDWTDKQEYSPLYRYRR